MIINTRAFALACGIFFGAVIFVGTWWLLIRGDLAGQETFLGGLYPGYRVSPLGSVIGLAYGGADGFFSGLLFSWLYNTIAARNSNDGKGRTS